MAPSTRSNRPWMGVTIFSLGYFLVFCLTSHSAKAAVAQKRGAATAKLEHLAARGPIVSLTDGNFTRYTEGRTRPYHLVVLFTALSPTYNCLACRVLEEPFVKVASAYAKQHDPLKVDNPVVFARVDITASSKTFQHFLVQTAPHVYLVPLGQTIPTGEALGLLELTKELSKPDGSVDEFLHEFSVITGAQLVILPDASGLLEGALMLAFAFGIVSHFFADVPSRVLAVVRCKGIWFAVSMACYMTGVGGMIYCIIRNPKPYGFDQRTGEAAMFSTGGRDQYWYEGVVVALFYVGMSAAITGVYTAAGWKRTPWIVRTTAVLACTTVLCYLAVEYFALYAKKTVWYSLPDMLTPAVATLHHGPLKRKHGLLKRLVRLSHLWLNEFTGIQAFQAKFKMLLWDYLLRNIKSARGVLGV